MTLGHLLFAVAITGYIVLAVRFEERDLMRVFGEQYRDYRRRVPMLMPGVGSRGTKLSTRSGPTRSTPS